MKSNPVEDNSGEQVDVASDYAIFTLSTENKIITWSNDAELVFGYTEDEIIGRSVDVLYDTEHGRINNPQKETAAPGLNGQATNVRWHLHKNGTRFLGSGITYPIKDAKGELISIVKVVRDITATRRFEDDKFFLAAIVATSNDSIITIDFHRNITSWNKAAEKLYGYTAEEAIGKKLSLLTLPEDFQLILQKVDAVENNREVVVFDTVRNKKDGETIQLEVVMSPVQNSLGDVIGVSTIARDVTERKRREERLAFLASINLDFATLLSIGQVMEEVGEQLVQYFNLYRCQFTIIDEDNDRAEVVYEYKRDKALPGANPAYRLSDHLTVEGRRQFAAGKPIVRTAAADNPNKLTSIEVNEEPGVILLADVPYIEVGRWRFLITVGRAEEGEWRTDELQLLQELASKIYIRIQRVHTEEMLCESEARLRTLTNAVLQVIWTNNSTGKANYFNQRWFEYSGLTFGQSEGFGWQAMIHPDDAPAVIAKWRRALDEGEIFETEYRLRRHDGVYRWFIGRNVPLKDASGKVSGWYGSATDIDNLKRTEEALSESEESLRITMESATDYAIITMDTHRRVEKWSKGATQIFGYTEAEMIGQSADIIFTKQDRDTGVPDQEMQTARGIGRAADERWHQKKNESRFFAMGVLRPIQNPELTGYVKVLRDMTEQRLSTEELQNLVNERTVELKRSNDDLLQFAHVASHDLKEPVRKVQTFCNRLTDELGEELPGKALTYIEKIVTAAKRMNAMVDGVLKYSKFNTAPQKLEPVNLNEIILQIENDLEVLIAEKSATIATGKLPTINVSNALIYQLFYNLILNSLKFSKPDEPPLITMSSSKLESNNASMYEILVSDNGIGFDPQFSQEVFTTFTRLNPVETYEGTGLGLALCKKIVERHKGSISVTTKENDGATFRILLPAN